LKGFFKQGKVYTRMISRLQILSMVFLSSLSLNFRGWEPQQDVKRSEVIGECHQRHRAIEFRKFLDTIDEAVPMNLDVHMILDNYGTHETLRIQHWLAKRPRYHLLLLLRVLRGSSWLGAGLRL
jgi:hypothetical protein